MPPKPPTASAAKALQTLTPEQSAINARRSLMAGTESQLGSSTHVGVAVDVRSSSGVSALMIPDATAVGEGSPVYLSKPIELDFAKLEAFLGKKKVSIPSAPVDLKKLMQNTKLVCGALYYCSDKMAVVDGKKTDKVEKPGMMLMSFSIKNDTGIIKSLTGDADLGDLFDVLGVSLRIFKCPEERLGELQAYVKELLADPITSEVEKALEADGNEPARPVDPA